MPHGVGWRGDGTGRYPEAKPPLRWSDRERLLWKTALPSRGNATPVLVGDLLFVTAEPDLLIAVRTLDGSIAWQREVKLSAALAASGDTETAHRLQTAEQQAAQLRDAEAELGRLKREARKESSGSAVRDQMHAVEESIAKLKGQSAQAEQGGAPTGSFVGDASQTPVSDGQSVFVAFGSFAVAAFDLQGNQRWVRYLPHPPTTQNDGERHGIGGSPMLAGDRLVVPMVQLYGLNPDTGAIEWTVPGMSQWGTPARLTLGGEDVIVTPGGQVVRAWDGQTLTNLIVPFRFVGPVVSGNTVLFSGLDMTPGAMVHNSFVEAWSLPEELAAGARPERLWSRDVGHGDYYGTPIVDDGHFIALMDEGRFLQVLDLKTGAIVHQKAVPSLAGMPVPSLAIAGRDLHVSFEQGDTLVMSTQAPYAERAHNKLSDTFHASPIFAGDRMYLRGFEALYCFGGTTPTPGSGTARP